MKHFHLLHCYNQEGDALPIVMSNNLITLDLFFLKTGLHIFPRYIKQVEPLSVSQVSLDRETRTVKDQNFIATPQVHRGFLC